jgi:hypothetical protein
MTRKLSSDAKQLLGLLEIALREIDRLFPDGIKLDRVFDPDKPVTPAVELLDTAEEYLDMAKEAIKQYIRERKVEEENEETRQPQMDDIIGRRIEQEFDDLPF